MSAEKLFMCLGKYGIAFYNGNRPTEKYDSASYNSFGVTTKLDKG
jgi:hypothetical protein